MASSFVVFCSNHGFLMLTASELLAAPLWPLLPVVEQPVMVQTCRLLTEQLHSISNCPMMWGIEVNIMGQN